MRETQVRSLGREDPWRRKWQPTPVFLPGKPHRQRSLIGYSPWGRKESDTTEWLHFTSLHVPYIPGSYAILFFTALDFTSITSHIHSWHCFCFTSISSFFLELFLHSFPVAHWAPSNLGSSSFSILSFCLFILFMGFSRQEYWSGLPLPSPVDHVLSKLSTMNCLFWMALHGTAHSLTELDKAVVHVISLISFL